MTHKNVEPISYEYPWTAYCCYVYNRRNGRSNRRCKRPAVVLGYCLQHGRRKVARLRRQADALEAMLNMPKVRKR